MTATIQPERLLRELDELWVSLGKQSEGVMRACTMTLIVVTEQPGEPLAELMREHPCRAIVLCVGPSGQQPLDARVTAQCWLPFGARQQICCEQVEVAAGARSLPSLAAFILPLTAPDLPVVIWFRSSRLATLPALQQLSRTADRIVVDSAQLGGLDGFRRLRAALGEESRVADLAWTRLTRWREIIAQIFENPAARDRISEAAILVGGTQGLPCEAAYLAGWLARGLGNVTPAFRRVPGGAGVQGILLSAPDLAVSVKLTEKAAVEVSVNAVTRTTEFPALSDCVLLREELFVTDRDKVFEESAKLAEQLAPREGGNL